MLGFCFVFVFGGVFFFILLDEKLIILALEATTHKAGMITNTFSTQSHKSTCNFLRLNRKVNV
jgi:hypothetical protein